MICTGAFAVAHQDNGAVNFVRRTWEMSGGGIENCKIWQSATLSIMEVGLCNDPYPLSVYFKEMIQTLHSECDLV